MAQRKLRLEEVFSLKWLDLLRTEMWAKEGAVWGGEGKQHKGCEAVGVAGCIQLSIKNLTSEINRVITVSFTFIVNQELTEYFDI
jgi:hypothetical protein